MSPMTRSAARGKLMKTASTRKTDQLNAPNTKIVKPVVTNGSRRSKRRIKTDLSPLVANRPTPLEYSGKGCKTEVENHPQINMCSPTEIITSIGSSSVNSSSSQSFLSAEDGTEHKLQEQQNCHAERAQLKSNLHATREDLRIMDERVSQLTAEYKMLHRLCINDQEQRYAHSEVLKDDKTGFQGYIDAVRDARTLQVAKDALCQCELNSQTSQIHGLEGKVRKLHLDHESLERSYRQTQTEIPEKLRLWVQQQLDQTKTDIKSEHMFFCSMPEKADIVRELLPALSQHNQNSLPPRDERYLDADQSIALLHLSRGSISDGRDNHQNTVPKTDIGPSKLANWTSKTSQAMHGRPQEPENKSRQIDHDVRTPQNLNTTGRLSQDVEAGNTSRKMTSSPPLYAFVNSISKSPVQSRSSLKKQTRDEREHVLQRRRPQQRTSHTPAVPINDMSDPLQALAVEVCPSGEIFASGDARSNFTSEESSSGAEDILP